jgi:hypothetical protein
VLIIPSTWDFQLGAYYAPSSCHRGELAYATGWLKLGPTVHWQIQRREGAVKTVHRTHCKHTKLPRFGALVRR